MDKVTELEQLVKAQKQYREESMKSLCDEIGRALHAEYEDYFETKDMPMNEMLGEIYRHKLEQIAKILSQYNINV